MFGLLGGLCGYVMSAFVHIYCCRCMSHHEITLALRAYCLCCLLCCYCAVLSLLHLHTKHFTADVLVVFPYHVLLLYGIIRKLAGR